MAPGSRLADCRWCGVTENAQTEDDAERASGTSATDDELGHAFATAADILPWLEARLYVRGHAPGT